MAISIVCGLHRSGTTYIGKILGCAGKNVVHEPLNERFGMKGVPIAYPYAEELNDMYSMLIDDAVNLNRPWNKDVQYIQVAGIRRNIYALTGGRSGLRWEWLKLRRNLGLAQAQIFLKDPFMSFATPYLVNKLQLKAVCMVRHPAAIHCSTEKQNWGFDIDNLLQQTELIARYGKDIPDLHWDMAREHAAASIAILWKLMVRVNIPLAEKRGRLLMITHESLCMKPQETGKIICKHFQIPFSTKLEGFIADHSDGESAEAKNGQTHDFKRNSKALVDAWKNKISTEDLDMILSLADEEIRAIYD